METYTITEFKARALRVIADVCKTGQPITITKRGKPVARVEPIKMQKPKFILGALKGTIKIVGDIVSPLEYEWEDPLKPFKYSRRAKNRR